ncbi:MAG: hypothetical protein CMN30_16360 [Sandaracinus sp.]|nr:hypothetical protein [Sandaracinus sp.]
MGFIQKIIDIILGMLGMKKSAPMSLGSATTPTTDHEKQRAAAQLQGTENLSGMEHVEVHGTGDDDEVVIRQNGASLIRDEDDGSELWVDTTDKEVIAANWQDDWGPLGGPNDESLVEFLYHEKNFDMAHEGDPRAAQEKLQGFGYQDVGHMFRVRTTILKHFGTAGGQTLDSYVFQSQQVMSAAMKAAQRMHQDTMSATAAANPEIVEPIEGVSVELYAQISAKAAQGMDMAQLEQELASHGLDKATWDRASAGWMQRMQNDTTATIATIYGQAFQSAGQGQFGAAGAAHAATGYDGTAAGGAEPIPFEKACEIQGATSAWSKTGQDVNALLQQTFQMNAADWAAANSWWMSQLTADVARFDEYNKKVEMYETQYMGAAAAPTDQDIAF